VYACPAIHFVREAQSSAAGPTLDTGGWLALTRPGLSPGKRRRALLGVITSTAACAKLRPRAKRWPQFGVGLADLLGDFGRFHSRAIMLIEPGPFPLYGTDDWVNPDRGALGPSSASAQVPPQPDGYGSPNGRPVR
jgi:hypothetical protein